MKSLLVCTVVGLLLIATSALMAPKEKFPAVSGKELSWLKQQSVGFAKFARALESAVDNADLRQPPSIEKARRILKECQLSYKHIAFFLEYFFPTQAKLYNGPPDPEIDEASLKYTQPVGLQVIESLLYDAHPGKVQNELVVQAHAMSKSAANLPVLFGRLRANDGQLLESIRIELIRVMTLYITGYDAPISKTGISEAAESLYAMDVALSPYVDRYSQKDSINYYLHAAINYLKTKSDFDSFDRLFFLTHLALPLQNQVSRLSFEENIMQSTTAVLNSNAENIFCSNAFNKKAFPYAEDENDTLLVGLGKKLFFENALSGNRSRNCSGCHSPEAYFADGIMRNTTLDGKDVLPRNTPTLLYACYQYNQFWDGRAAGLKEQIAAVLKNKKEMDGDDNTIVNRLQKDSFYVERFKKIWSVKDHDDYITMNHVISAIGAYIQTLAPFRSPFDKYIQGDQSALSAAQQRGFNLFMGKAKCGTCHFAPLFNGLTPPLYNETEFEILGTPFDDSLEHPRPDTDKGRYAIVPTRFNDGAFKTPTVRNAAVTGPYMHNGKFKNLEKVISFYDKGGGIGLGLKIAGQTLPSTPLHLDDKEKADLISFIGALTDTKP